MSHISLPEKVKIEVSQDNPHQSEVVIGPCFPGFGQTIGNSLRRVLLSSIPGSAVYSLKLKGASHEFDTLPGVKEDILRIILNLKKLKLKVLDGETLTLNLNASGVKKVTAADIEKNASVEIANPELEICSLTEESSSLELELNIATGYGYSPVEGRPESSDVGLIQVDSVYTPVVKVGLEIENVRVGDRVDYDQVKLTLETDGTVTAAEVIELATKTLIDQFNAVQTQLQ